MKVPAALAPLGALLALATAPTASALAPVAQVREAVAFTGTWVGEMPYPGRVELEPFRLELARSADAVTGSLSFVESQLPLEGRFDPAGGRLLLDGAAQGLAVRLDLLVAGDRLSGRLERPRGDVIELVAGRATEKTLARRLVVDFSTERPRTVSRDGLPAALVARIEAAVLLLMENQSAVGLSAAVVVDGEVVDVRSFGWEDHHDGIPASDVTMYRWASISKSLTAVAALQLWEKGQLDLDRDVREYVPEYDMGAVITSRQLLCHQGGVVHYQDMLTRTMKEYEHPHPWSDRVIALDMFNESPLLFEPGTQYSYTTPGYSVLGAVIERAGKASYDEQVRERICEPLGMDSMQPDYQWVEIPHRSRGYHREGDEVVDSGDNNIAWKLPAGGFISTVGDLARFGAGLMGPDLLTLETQLAMWEAQATSTGERTNYGLGIGVGEFRGVKTVSHSGGQRKTSTFLLVCPDYGLAVALMCNTSGTGLSDLAREIMGFVMDQG